MNRRQALAAMINVLGLAGASSVFGASAWAESTSPRAARPVLGSGDLKLLEAVAETIIPTTDGSPGARASGIGAFFQEMITDYYSAEEQRIVLAGLGEFRSLVAATGKKHFGELDGSQREALLLALEVDADAIYYRMIKQLTVWGYFSSEVGVKQALRFAPIPGRYDGDVKIKPGARAWADIGA